MCQLRRLLGSATVLEGSPKASDGLSKTQRVSLTSQAPSKKQDTPSDANASPQNGSPASDIRKKQVQHTPKAIKRPAEQGTLEKPASKSRRPSFDASQLSDHPESVKNESPMDQVMAVQVKDVPNPDMPGPLVSGGDVFDLIPREAVRPLVISAAWLRSQPEVWA